MNISLDGFSKGQMVGITIGSTVLSAVVSAGVTHLLNRSLQKEIAETALKKQEVMLQRQIEDNKVQMAQLIQQISVMSAQQAQTQATSDMNKVQALMFATAQAAMASGSMQEGATKEAANAG